MSRFLSESHLAGSQKFPEFGRSQSGLTYDSPQSPFCDFLVIRHSQSTMGRRFLPQNDVAATLMIGKVSDLTQYLAQFSCRYYWQLAQTVTSTISSSIDGGTGSLCFFRLSKYPLMAS